MLAAAFLLTATVAVAGVRHRVRAPIESPEAPAVSTDAGTDRPEQETLDVIDERLRVQLKKLSRS